MAITVFKNGDIKFSNKESIIKLSENYKQDKDDPLMYRLDWCPCRYRIEKMGECRKSKRQTLLPWCQLFDKVISPNTCNACTVPDKTG
jgi:hypothetical protein